MDSGEAALGTGMGWQWGQVEWQGEKGWGVSGVNKGWRWGQGLGGDGDVSRVAVREGLGGNGDNKGQ